MSIRLLLFFAARARVSEEHDTQAKQIVARFEHVFRWLSVSLYRRCYSTFAFRRTIEN